MCVRRFFFFLLNILGGVESLGSRMTQYDILNLISATLYFNVFYKYLSNKKLLRILPCQKFHLS